MDSVNKIFCSAPDLKMVKPEKVTNDLKSIWLHNIFESVFCGKNDITFHSVTTHKQNIPHNFFYKKMVPECKTDWNREALTVFPMYSKIPLF